MKTIRMQTKDWNPVVAKSIFSHGGQESCVCVCVWIIVDY